MQAKGSFWKSRENHVQMLVTLEHLMELVNLANPKRHQNVRNQRTKLVERINAVDKLLCKTPDDADTRNDRVALSSSNFPPDKLQVGRKGDVLNVV